MVANILLSGFSMSVLLAGNAVFKKIHILHIIITIIGMLIVDFVLPE